MTAIVPRWEWRTFGSRFAAATEELLARVAAGPAVETEELYLLASEGANVKVRDDLMDIKLLREVDAHGLERWEPVMKAAFPLQAEDVRGTLDALGIPAGSIRAEPYPLGRFLDEVVAPSDMVRPIRIVKRRSRFRLSGCMAEHAEVTAEGRTIRTVAVESEDPAAVIAAVRDAGLGTYLNTSYPRGLRGVLEDPGERFGVIDVGTNSVKFHLGERGADGTWRTLVDRAEVTRLGEGVEAGGSIGAEPLERTIGAVGGMVEEARRGHARAIVAVGTAALRNARNRDAVLAAFADRGGVTVEVLSGEDESRLAFLAVRQPLADPAGSLVVFDTGGGSTQFTFGRGSEVLERFSVDVGAVRVTERFGLDRAVDVETVEAARAAIAADLSRIRGRPTPDALVAMGGAVTNLTAVMLALDPYDPERVQGAGLDLAEVDRQIERYRSLDAEGRRSIVGLQPARAEVILAGACVVRTVMELLGRQALTVSDRGLRHGVLFERFGP